MDEPFGKDHAASGGSYDVSSVISEKIFDYPAPFPVPYEWILHLLHVHQDLPIAYGTSRDFDYRPDLSYVPGDVHPWKRF